MRLHQPTRTRKERRTVEFCIKPLTPLILLTLEVLATKGEQTLVTLEVLATKGEQTLVYRKGDVAEREKSMLANLEFAQVRWKNAPMASGTSPLRHLYFDFRNCTSFGRAWWYTPVELAKARYSVEALVSGTELPVFGLSRGNNCHLLTVCSDSQGLEAKLNRADDKGRYGPPAYCTAPILEAFKRMESNGDIEARGVYTVTSEKPYAPVISSIVRHASAVLIAAPSYTLAAGVSLAAGLAATLPVAIISSETLLKIPVIKRYYWEHVANTGYDEWAIPGVLTAVLAIPLFNCATQIVLDSARGIEGRFNRRLSRVNSDKGSYASSSPAASA